MKALVCHYFKKDIPGEETKLWMDVCPDRTQWNTDTTAA